MGGVELEGFRGAVGGWANASAEGVVETWGGGSAGRFGGEVGVEGGVAGGGGDAHRLMRVSCEVWVRSPLVT